LSNRKPNLEDCVVLLDRDGTVIRHVHHLVDPSRAELLHGVGEAVQRLNDLGAKVIISTNQSVIARGLATIEEVDAVNNRVVEMLRVHRAHIDGFFVCPHRQEDHCKCRKPSIEGMREYLNDLGLADHRGFVIGDNVTDMLFADRLGFTGLHVSTGVDRPQRVGSLARLALLFETLTDAVMWISSSIEGKQVIDHARPVPDH